MSAPWPTLSDGWAVPDPAAWAVDFGTWAVDFGRWPDLPPWDVSANMPSGTQGDRKRHPKKAGRVGGVTLG